MNFVTAPRQFDVCIAGAGIIGLSLALSLRSRGLSVLVIERGHAMREASWAAAGMLAARDLENPAPLSPLSELSLSLYPGFLSHIESLTRHPVPFRTRLTIQQLHSSAATHSESNLNASQIRSLIPGLRASDIVFKSIEENSLDPRDLCTVLPRAVSAAGISLIENTTVTAVTAQPGGVTIATDHGSYTAGKFVNCCGAWSGLELKDAAAESVRPRKGQMVTVEYPATLLSCVLRTPVFYSVPRGDGRVIVGATVEDIGFDKAVHSADLDRLLARANDLLPGIASAPRLESWAGLRPGTPDDLPILGPASAPNCFLATGHFRNGILLAPATAHVLTQLLCGESPSVPLDPFSPARFAPVSR